MFPTPAIKQIRMARGEDAVLVDYELRNNLPYGMDVDGNDAERQDNKDDGDGHGDADGGNDADSPASVAAKAAAVAGATGVVTCTCRRTA
jgi:hypothetical protein